MINDNDLKTIEEYVSSLCTFHTFMNVTRLQKDEMTLHIHLGHKAVTFDVWEKLGVLCADFTILGRYDSEYHFSIQTIAEQIMNKIKEICCSTGRYRLKIMTGSLEWRDCWLE